MRGRRPPLLVLCAIALAAGAFAAGRGDTPVGVLLGLRGPSGYRTLWIQSRGGDLVLSRDLATIVVPHGSRLCRLLFSTATSVDPDDMDDKRKYEESAITLDCGDPVPEHTAETAPGCEGGNSLAVPLITSSHIAVDAHSESVCNGRVNAYSERSVSPLDELLGHWSQPREGLPLDALGPARQALTAAAVRECNRVESEDPILEYLHLESCSRATPDHWLIRRGFGEWQIVGWTSGERGNELEYSIRGEVPAVVHAWTRSALTARAVRGAAPGAADFVTSPDDRFALVLRANALYTGRVQGGRLTLGRALAATHPDDRVVSIEWATGTHVARWDGLVRRLPNAGSHEADGHE